MPSGVFSPLPGQGLFIARNYTRTTWQIELGDATLALPPLEPGRGYAEIRLDLEPGTYTWQAFAPEKDRALLTDEETHTLHGFAIHAGEVYFARVLSLAPGQHVIPYVVEPVLFVP